MARGFSMNLMNVGDKMKKVVNLFFGLISRLLIEIRDKGGLKGPVY